jgi:hypothetical protein
VWRFVFTRKFLDLMAIDEITPKHILMGREGICPIVVPWGYVTNGLFGSPFGSIKMMHKKHFDGLRTIRRVHVIQRCPKN